MTTQEYSEKEELLKRNTLGKTIDYDGEYGGQCFDLTQMWWTQYLGIPANVLGGCGYVSNMLIPPKLDQMLEYFDEVPTGQMIKGDTVFWETYPHTAIFDHWDGVNCWFLSQNNPIPNVTDLAIIDTVNMRAFRLKNLVYEPSAEEKLKVVKEKLQEIIDYIG